MKYFAKLTFGGLYKYNGKDFYLGENTEVTKDEADYLKARTDDRLVEQGISWTVIKHPIFAISEIAPTVQEKVLEEIKTAPDSLKPKRL